MEEPVSAAKKAADAWKSAPPHVKMMAGQYVEPILWALADYGPRIAMLEGAVFGILPRVEVQGLEGAK